MELVLKQFDTLDELIADKMDTGTVPDDFEMPEFPIPTEDVNSIDDILHLIQFLKDHKLENICPKYRKLVDCEDIIRDFNQMVGLEGPKANIATQILSLCNRVPTPRTVDKSSPSLTVVGTSIKKDNRKKTGKNNDEEEATELHIDEGDNNDPLLNTVIYGPPGCGKTTIAHFLSKLYLKFGIVDGKIIKGDRASLIGQWVGETAIKTKKVLTQAIGGILFIDEAYQLGHAADGNRCPFAYECINTITQFITEHKGRITIILAGYKKDIQQNFFAQNEGLDRRFPWKYTLEQSKAEDLVQILRLQASKAGYTIGSSETDLSHYALSLFQKDKDMFKNGGGDTQTLFDKCKMVHDKRMFSCLRPDKIISKIDLEKGYAIYKKIKDEHKEDGPPLGMYC